MAAFSIRNVPNKVHAWLREDEARMSGSELQEWVDSLYGTGKPGDAVEELIAERRREGAGE